MLNFLIKIHMAILWCLFILNPLHSFAENIPFDAKWQPLNFRGIPQTQYIFKDTRLDIRASQSSSVIFRALPSNLRNATKASWSWQVDVSVPPSDLSRKGGDDRNIALYFVFTDPKTSQLLGANPNVRRLLTSRSSRIIMYVFGGQSSPGSFIPSPYFQGRGTTIIKRSAGIGSYVETVDLIADFRRAFNTQPGVLVGIAISSDSDDTKIISQASLSSINLQ